MPDSIDAILNDWRNWPVAQRPEVIRKFDAGRNHQTWLLDAHGSLLVLKIFKPAANKGIRAQQWASNHQLAPEIVYIDAKQRYIMMHYIDSPALSALDIDDKSLAEIAKAVRKLHTADCQELGEPLGKFDLQRYCESYLAGLDTSIQQTHKALWPVIEYFIDDQTPTCFCHNDLISNNSFINKGQIQFIDWEYAQLNNPWFDLAAIINYLELDNQQVGYFLESYRTGWGSQTDKPIYHASLVAQLWLDVLWYLAHSSTDLSPHRTKLARISHHARPLGVSLTLAS